MYQSNNTELSSLEGTRSEFNPGSTVIKLGIDVHQGFYVVVRQVGGTQPQPAQRFKKEAFVRWAAKLKQSSGAEIHARQGRPRRADRRRGGKRQIRVYTGDRLGVEREAGLC